MENNFGKNLRYLRLKHKLSQDQLAEMLDYKSFTTIQKWESGNAEPTFSTIIKLARIFNVKIDDLANKNLGLEDKPENNYLIYSDDDFELFSETRIVSQGADKFLRKNLLSMTEEKPPTREYMITWLNENMIRYASSGGVNYEQMNDDELRGYYESAKEKIEGD